jgi:Fe-S-cluster containining protein
MAVVKKTNNVWYIAGLHFACQQCGDCCSGPQEGVIWISKPEIQLLAKHLGLDASELRKKYLKRIGFRYSIKENPCSKDCVFLVSINGQKSCTIYNVRPMQCRNWPFWPANLNSPDDWNIAAKKCPGINKGRFYTFAEIQKIQKHKRWPTCLTTTPVVGVQGRDNSRATTLKICDEVAQIYSWLDSNIKPLNYQCEACGKCCNFESFGHKLFVTTPELLYFSRNVKKLKLISTQSCPYLEDGRCSVRNYRFAGCRIFFCKSAGGCLTAADKDWQNKLSEETIRKFKTLCEKCNFSYRYIDLMTALNNPELYG